MYTRTHERRSFLVASANEQTSGSVHHMVIGMMMREKDTGWDQFVPMDLNRKKQTVIVWIPRREHVMVHTRMIYEQTTLFTSCPSIIRCILLMCQIYAINGLISVNSQIRFCLQFPKPVNMTEKEKEKNKLKKPLQVLHWLKRCSRVLHVQHLWAIVQCTSKSYKLRWSKLIVDGRENWKQTSKQMQI